VPVSGERGRRHHTVLVTGANGFVGRHLLTALHERFPSAAVVGTSLETSSGLLGLDVTDVAAVRRTIGQVRPDTCIHLAALASVYQSFSDPRAVWEVNLGGTLSVAEALLDLVPECRLVYPSSGEIYGLSFRDRKAVGEDTPLHPANPYAVSKAAADLALGEMALRGLRVIRLRLFNHTGPGQTERYVLPRFAAQVARIAEGMQDPVIHTGALDRWRDFLDVRDVVKAYLAALETPAEDLCVNICSGVPRRMGDVLASLMELAQISAEVVECISDSRRMDIPSSLGSPRMAAEILKWRPEVAWLETLQTLFAYWRGRVSEESV
jgi:GDP-4-dehydro-6-deoxy-D-mannose reductase